MRSRPPPSTCRRSCRAQAPRPAAARARARARRRNLHRARSRSLQSPMPRCCRSTRYWSGPPAARRRAARRRSHRRRCSTCSRATSTHRRAPMAPRALSFSLCNPARRRSLRAHCLHRRRLWCSRHSRHWLLSLTRRRRRRRWLRCRTTSIKPPWYTSQSRHSLRL